MEYIVFIAVVMIILFLRFRIGEKRRRQRWIQRLKNEWGQVPVQEYEDGDLRRIARYHVMCGERESAAKTDIPMSGQRGSAPPFYLDDITWDDLGMDDIFMLLNYTQSSVGEEALYHMLRTPSANRAVLEERARLAKLFTEDAALRLELEKQLSRIGKKGRYALCDMIADLSEQPERSNMVHYFGLVAFLAAIGVMCFVPSAGIVMLVGVIVFQMITYYQQKAKVETYFTNVARTVRLAVYGRQICDVISNVDELKTYRESLAESVKVLEPIRRKARLIAMGNDMGGSPLDLIADYLKMLVHIDLIAYNQVIALAKEREKDIWNVMEILGQLECALAIASLRKCLDVWCEPEFGELKSERPEVTRDHRTANVSLNEKSNANVSDCGLSLCGDGLYHPLIDHAVPNTIHAERCQLITGSNASGKSTFLKTVAINAILAQTIYTVAGTRYAAPFYQIYSSMALTDNLRGGESYYMVEIRSLKRILDRGHDDLPVLCFVDEVLRGTNTLERIAASAQILRSMADMNILCFAATHDGELTYLLEPWYDNSHFEEEVSEGDVLFSYRLYSGRAVSRNALKLLGLMGYDSEVLADAESMARRFEQTGLWSMNDES